jgi:isocitrate dehydrogenase kinase/phosphatase
LPDLLANALTDADGAVFARERWCNLDRAVTTAAERISAATKPLASPKLEVFRGAFYRGRGAYLIARMINGESVTPLALCLRQREKGGLTLDAVLIGESDLAILFSYTRAYFRVATPSPYELVQWLRALMPGKRAADLYNAVGRLFRRRRRRTRDGHARLYAAKLRRGLQAHPRPVRGAEGERP